MMTKKIAVCMGTLALWLTIIAPAFGQEQVPWTMSHFGYLEEEPDKAMNKVVEMTFSIFAEGTEGGEPLWTEVHEGVEVKHGFYKVLLGSKKPLVDLACDGRYIVEVKVAGTSIPVRREPMLDPGGCLTPDVPVAEAGSPSTPGAVSSAPEVIVRPEEGRAGAAVVPVTVEAMPTAVATNTAASPGLENLGADLERAMSGLSDASIRQQPDSLLLTLQSDLLFAQKTSTFKPGVRDTIKRIAAVLKNHPDAEADITVHTDSIGYYGFSKDLSQKQAASLKSALLQEGVPARRLNVVGLGEARPLEDNGLEWGRRVNRRIEMAIASH
jgi:outer membrane protein OmpA-like peptidoglycan-associated protein